MQLNDLGRIVADEWVKTADIRPEIGLDAWVVMPNHFHGIVVMINGRGTARRAPTTAATKRINEFRHTPGMPVWQRNYYEHIIRNETSLAKIREYIINNPQQWELDRENPTNIRTD